MNLWILRVLPNVNLPYDSNHGFVIRASCKTKARALAQSKAANEGQIWEDESLTECVRLRQMGPEEIVLTDFLAG